MDGVAFSSEFLYNCFISKYRKGMLMNFQKSLSRQLALGGVLAALAICIMCLGGIIPVATYVSPMLCALVLQVVFCFCGSKISWAWYGAVSILALLLSPDREAAATFVFLGYYPIVKPRLDEMKLSWLWKGVVFNGSIGLMYWLLLSVFGFAQLKEEFSQIQTVFLLLMLVLGNFTFFLLDKVLEKPFFRKLGNRGK